MTLIVPPSQDVFIQIPKVILRVSEIFFSLQGETSRVGLPTVFVRLTGCPLRCNYCDTKYAFYGGEGMSISTVLAEIDGYKARYVTITGGEPLAQKECLILLRILCETGYLVSLETSGALDVSQVDARVSKILDIKTPGSGEVEKNCWANLNYLTQHDELKFVLCDEADYQWAIEMMHKYLMGNICPILFSPVYGQLDPALLATWVLRDRLQVRMQIQLHKLLWGEGPGR
ncbi:MAG: 7-carboxy-7-deazaguanine synthase QueE [Nitrosospira sp.]|nr:7-carboxy-7-deazaguanine synthase QueE [Nitrosospira sp.]MDW7642912.1 7-carboxy-7-deazaguanine synthase QueE [Nitrosomonadaceae bacterium]MBI0416564.1 7-carboxy-7-deazaguanine synthase QueE [Nitrosospira sp.]MBI0419834.1 7-carboxy-7-deazaguanine synthase QueE [Nitrosospira sp.]MDW7653396.1 7-carboxy-7-deazaguanine synthase QueE [Nitrosomonadaceae bacterium]